MGVLKTKDNIIDPNIIIKARDVEFFENVFPMKFKSIGIEEVNESDITATSKYAYEKVVEEIQPKKVLGLEEKLT